MPLQYSSIVDTPPPFSKLSKSSVVSHGSTFVESIALPEPGETFCGFQLVEELGRGTFARVYLAKQATLAGREVAVKVTLRATREPERLARLQHTNVVPVYSVHEAAPAQVICMPYLGRRTLADALTGFRKSIGPAAGLSTRKGIATKRGSSVAASRTGSTDSQTEPKSGTRPVVSTMQGAIVGKVEAVLPILIQLADGLAHAHDRGVLHLDLKPANVLLADTGEPMLLDFNLSYAEAEGKRDVVGGTIPYMAPEQLHDLRERGKGHVDARTDLYSLGVVAFELLTGKHPFPVTPRSLTDFDGLIAVRNQGAPSVRDVNPGVPAAVAAIVAKLLAARPESRYQTARELCEDLDRQQTDRPLKFAPDRSIAERIGKWRRRNPKLVIAAVVAATLLLAGGATAFALGEIDKRETRDAEARVRQTRDGLAAVRLDLILPDPAGRARGLSKAMTLLAAFELPQNPNWQTGAFRRVPADQRASLAGDLGELLLLVANARWDEGKSANKAEAASDARLLNELAKGCFGENPPPMLVRQRAEIDGTRVVPPAPQSARDNFLDGASFFAASKFDAAIQPLEKAVAAQPDHGAAHFLLARSRQHMGQYEAAVERYKSAAVLLPNDPRPAYFSGVSLGLSGQHSAAADQFTTAIGLDPKYGDAYLTRGIANLELQEYRDADRDLTAGLERGAPKLQCLYFRARVRSILNDETGAEADRKAADALKPERDADFIARGFTRIKTAPREALADFQRAIELNPSSISARRNTIQVLADELQDDAKALSAANDLVKFFPDYMPGRAARALCLARLGRRSDAIREVEACQKILTAKGPSYRDPKVVYRLALVYAVTSTREANDRTLALQLFKEAVRSGFCDFPALEQDRDLAAIREWSSFKDAVKAAKELAD